MVERACTMDTNIRKTYVYEYTLWSPAVTAGGIRLSLLHIFTILPFQESSYNDYLIYILHSSYVITEIN